MVYFVRNLFILMTFLVFASCENEVELEGVQVAAATSCSPVTSSFEGIKSVSDVTDYSAKIFWESDPYAISYGIFRVTDSRHELIENVSSATTNYTISPLNPSTAYKFIVKSLTAEAQYDSNEVVAKLTTLAKSTFVSCKDIYDYNSGTAPSGTYTIDPDLGGSNAPIDVYCEMDNLGGGWTKLLYHDGNGGMFANKSDALEKNVDDHTEDLYSIIFLLEHFKRDNKFEFWIRYPDIDGVTGGNHWTQTSNPLSELISGYTAIQEDHTASYWGGVEPSNPSDALIDGSVSHTYWYYAIGSYNTHGGATSFPGPGGSVERVEFFVK